MRRLASLLRRLTVVALALAVGAALLRFVPGPDERPDWWIRFARRTNPIFYRLGLVGGRHSSLGSLQYVGRKSGILRQTPVYPFVAEAHVIVGLPYTRAVDWARNVMASGYCRMQFHGQVYELDEPEVRSSAELPELPEWRKREFSDSMEYLRLRILRVQSGTLDSFRPVEVSEAHEQAVKPEPVASDAAFV